jgi:hypothetical protein
MIRAPLLQRRSGIGHLHSLTGLPDLERHEYNERIGHGANVGFRVVFRGACPVERAAGGVSGR